MSLSRQWRRLDMQNLTWLKPAIIGAVAGGILTALVGFNYGGWVSGSSAERMASQQATAAVTAALLPVCVSQSKADPQTTAKTAQLGALNPGMSAATSS
jgi:alpha/beta superfamily hydrolase